MERLNHKQNVVSIAPQPLRSHWALEMAAQALHSAAHTLYSAAHAQYSAAQALYSAAHTPYSPAQALHAAAHTPHSAAQARYSVAHRCVYCQALETQTRSKKRSNNLFEMYGQKYDTSERPQTAFFLITWLRSLG